MKHNARAYLASAGAFVPHWLLARTEISHGAKLTYASLAQKVDDRGMVRAHLAKLAAHIGSEVLQVMLFLVELEKWGLIEIQSPPAEADSLYCRLPDHPWMDRSEPGTTNGSSDSGALKGNQRHTVARVILTHTLGWISSAGRRERRLVTGSLTASR